MSAQWGRQIVDAIMGSTSAPFPDTGATIGNIEGVIEKTVYGNNSSVNAGYLPEDIWEYGGEYQGMRKGAIRSLGFSSTSSEDSFNGIGARRIELFGLDSNFNETSSRYITSGTNNQVALRFARCNYIMVVETGSNNKPVGTITVQNNVGENSRFAVIYPGSNIGSVAAFTTPRGKSAIIKNVQTSGYRGDTGEGFFNVQLYVKRWNDLIWYRLGDFPNHFTNGGVTSKVNGVIIPEKTDVKLHINRMSAMGNQMVSGRINYTEIDNSLINMDDVRYAI